MVGGGGAPYVASPHPLVGSVVHFVVFRDKLLWHWALHSADRQTVSGSEDGYDDPQACFRSVDRARQELMDDEAEEQRAPEVPAPGARDFVLVRERRY
jgi:hypothetical protein